MISRVQSSTSCPPAQKRLCGQHQPSGQRIVRPARNARAASTCMRELRTHPGSVLEAFMISCVHNITRLLSILLLEHLSTSSALLHASAAHLLPYSCHTSSVRMRSVPEEPAKHEECFQDTPSMFQKRKGSVPVPAMRIPLFQERPGSVTLFQKRYRSVRGASCEGRGKC